MNARGIMFVYYVADLVRRSRRRVLSIRASLNPQLRGWVLRLLKLGSCEAWRFTCHLSSERHSYSGFTYRIFHTFLLAAKYLIGCGYPKKLSWVCLYLWGGLSSLTIGVSIFPYALPG